MLYTTCDRRTAEAEICHSTEQTHLKKDDIIAGLPEGAEILYNTTALETEKKRLWDEMCVLAEMVQAAINENVHVALDQKEYQKRYDELTARYDGVKGNAVSSEIGTVNVTLDANSTWTLTADTYVTSFSGNAENVICNSYTLYIGRTALTGTK